MVTIVQRKNRAGNTVGTGYQHRQARPLLSKAPQAHGVAAIAAVVAEITITEATRYQVVTVVALVAQVAIRTVAHR